MKPLFDPQRYIRDYFDLGVEFGFTSDENKLLEIANCVYHGFNLYESLKEHCEEHPERKSRFCLTLTKYIELIRGEKNGVITTLYSYDQFTFKQLVDLLEEESNNWHVHHGAVQVLICVSGRGWYQEWDKPAVELKPGVTIAVPEGVKHWHGAAKDSWMQHLTYHANAKPDNSNECLEPVTDEQYSTLQ